MSVLHIDFVKTLIALFKDLATGSCTQLSELGFLFTRDWGTENLFENLFDVLWRLYSAIDFELLKFIAVRSYFLVGTGFLTRYVGSILTRYVVSVS